MTKISSDVTIQQDGNAKKTSNLAIVSMIIGMLAIPLAFLSFKSYLVLIPFGFSVILAPILGITALIRIAMSKNKIRGRLLAILGICASPVSIICFFFYWITHFTLPA